MLVKTRGINISMLTLGCCLPPFYQNFWLRACFIYVCPCLKTLVTPLIVTYIFSEKEAALGLPQLGLRFLADSNIWNVNRKPQSCETDPQEY